MQLLHYTVYSHSYGCLNTVLFWDYEDKNLWRWDRVVEIQSVFYSIFTTRRVMRAISWIMNGPEWLWAE